MKVFFQITGGIMWFLFPLLGLSLLLSPFCNYGMSMAEILKLIGVMMSGLALLTLWENYRFRGVPQKKSHTIGSFSLSLYTVSNNQAEIKGEFIIWGILFSVLTVLVALAVYAKMTSIALGVKISHVENVLIFDALALFVIAQSFVLKITEHCSKKVTA